MEILVDPEDKWLIEAYHFYPVKCGPGKNYYADCYIRGVKPYPAHMRLHHAILGRPINGVTKHINGNGLDCRRFNLRIISRRKNVLNQKKVNKTGWPGVSKRGNSYRAMIRIKGKKTHIGSYKSAEKAHIAYLMAGGETRF